MAKKVEIANNTSVHQATYRIGSFTLNFDHREIIVNGQRVALTFKEYAVLELLVTSPGVPHTKHILLKKLYPNQTQPDARLIDVFIFNVRSKLAAAGAGDLIDTVWGRGYMMRSDRSN